jgi:hypothetical protein
MGGSRLARAGDSAARARPGSGLLRAGITLGNSGRIPRAERAQDSSVVHASSPSRRWRGRAVRRLVAFCPTSGPRNTGRSSGFRLLGCRAGTGIPAGNRSQPGNAGLRRSRRHRAQAKKAQPWQVPGIPAKSRWRAPFACRRPAAPQATRPRPSIGWLADPPEGWTTSMTLPLATKRMGRKIPSPTGCRCGSEGPAQH